jgi:hypothetical protein
LFQDKESNIFFGGAKEPSSIKDTLTNLFYLLRARRRQMNKKLFATSKMLIFSQKRFEGNPRLEAIRVAYPPKVEKLII